MSKEVKVVKIYDRNPNTDRKELEQSELYLINNKKLKHSKLEEYCVKNYNWHFNDKQFTIWSETISSWKININKSRIIENENIPIMVHYTPDFIINDWIVEIKGYNSHYIEYWALKEKLIKRFCYENGYKFITIKDKKELELFYNIYKKELE